LFAPFPDVLCVCIGSLASYSLLAEYLHPSAQPSHSMIQSSRLGTSSDTIWCQRRCCRPLSQALSKFLLSLSTSLSARGGTCTSAITFTTAGIAPAGDPLMAVITPHHVEVWVGL